MKKLDLIPTVLRSLLSLRRPYGSVEEGIAGDLVRKAVLEHAPHIVWDKDAHGNTWAQVGEDNGVVFTAHLDTVHRTPGTQELFILDLDQGTFIGADHEGKETVLGADDAAGIFLMTEMMKAGVAGKYMFFIGEECGGIGSSAFVRDNPDFSANVVVSFDRRGTGSVITHQGGWETCSPQFGAALAKALNQNGAGTLAYHTDDGGLYTDSREFAEIVPECTNVSVGYFHEHTAKETLNLTHLLNLRDALLKIEWGKLPVHRVPVSDVAWDADWAGRSSTWYDVPKDNTKELSGRITTYINGHWDAVSSDLRQLLLDMEEYLDGQI